MNHLALLGSALCLLAMVTLGCNTIYYAQVRTFPPVVADVYIDDDLKGRTAETGETTVNSGRKSIFAGTVLSLQTEDGRKGVYVMRYPPNTAAAVSHVVLAGGWDVGPDLHYMITFSFEHLPPRPARTGSIKAGPNKLSIYNPNDVMVWVSLRGSGQGDDYILGKNETIVDPLPDGDYRMFLIYADELRLIEMEEQIHLDGGDASVEVPRRAAGEPLEPQPG